MMHTGSTLAAAVFVDHFFDIEFRADEGFEPAARSSPAFAAMGAAGAGGNPEPAPGLDIGSLIRDERGVRVAPEAED